MRYVIQPSPRALMAVRYRLPCEHKPRIVVCMGNVIHVPRDDASAGTEKCAPQGLV